MPAHLEEPLTVVLTLPGGVVHRRSLHDLPNPRLASGLASAMVAATHPHGPIRTRSVARQYLTTLRRMTLDLHEQGFDGALGDLDVALLVRYWLTCDYHRERRIRVLLSAYQRDIGGLSDQIVRHLSGRRINVAGKSAPLQPYSDAEWERLRAACAEMIGRARRAHDELVTAAATGNDPVVHGADRANLAWLLTRTGPLPLRQLRELLGRCAEQLTDAAILEVDSALFPTAHIALAYLTLLGMRTGIVPDGLDDLTVDDITRTSPGTALLAYRKGRSGEEVLNISREAVRLLDQWLDHSTLLRGHAGADAHRMWIHIGGRRHRGGGHRPSGIYLRPRGQRHRVAWIEETCLLGDDGTPLPLHGGRIRVTCLQRRDRGNWTGHTTIDPNHTAAVEGDHYLSSHTPAQLDAIEGIIEEAQHDQRRKAAPSVLTGQETVAEFAARFPQLVTEAGMDGAVITAVLSGEQDVFVAACAAPLNSPHAPAGTLCPARPWVCLLCPLAVFAPRHLPNLLRLKDFLGRQSRRMTVAQFMRVFGPYAVRLDEDILSRFATAEIDAATRLVGTGTAGLPMHLEEL
ncbi:hypothetical protein [Mycobacterium intracellulare]|uniref:hypothetical protein n=1 Tax=Mycobacterium intracellulare TaxID=1767 RepID=UPI0006CAA3E5|nr:hypothetical protein [Mycobacterium intracellulare]KPN46507.1 hypothetical protein AN933_25915 [Mycobacterium intracellulare subsp. chimaera]